MNTTTQTPTAPPAFRGWWRPNRRTAWTCITEGGTYDETLDRLLDALASVKGGDSLVTRATTDPNAPRRPFVAGGRRRL